VLNIKLINKSKNVNPNYQREGDAGVDLHCDLETEKVIKPFERVLIPTGIYISLPENYEAQVRPRSGLAINHGITVINSPGTIDSNYTGEIKIGLINLSTTDYTISSGERVAQLVFSPVEKVKFITVDVLESTARNEKGFGSSGKF